MSEPAIFQKIQINRFEPSKDLEVLYKCYLDPSYSEFFRRTAPDLNIAELSQLDNSSNRLYTVRTNDIVGFITLNNSDPFGLSASYGCLILKEYQDTPIDNFKISFLALTKFHKFMFEKTFINKLSARILADRIDIKSSLEQSNYEQEAYFKEAVLYKGKLCDEVEMAIFKNNFLEAYNGWFETSVSTPPQN